MLLFNNKMKNLRKSLNCSEALKLACEEVGVEPDRASAGKAVMGYILQCHKGIEKSQVYC